MRFFPSIFRYFGVQLRIVGPLGFLLLLGCHQEDKLDLVFARRSILNDRPRMISLRFDDDYYLSYDLQRGMLRRFWKGGIFWNGANYNSIKTIQPTSWGHNFLENESNHSPWTFEENGERVIPTVHYEGYTKQHGDITFKYNLESAQQTVSLQESPHLLMVNDQLQLVREIEWTSNASSPKLFYEGELLKKSKSKVVSEFMAAETPEKPSIKATANIGKFWIEKSGCPTCHYENEKMIGPSYQEIADRYPKGDSTVEMLVQRVHEGSSGNWGQVPMIPHPTLSKADIAPMIKYIMSLKKTESKPAPYNKGVVHQSTTRTIPGFGYPLEGIHPSFDLITVRPNSFQPRVGGMDFTDDGDLLLCTWDSLGAVYRMKDITSGDTSTMQITRIAEGLAEPLGLKVVDSKIFVVQKNEVTELIDLDGDQIIDYYRNVCDDFGVTTDFHEYSYGLESRDGKLYATLGVAMRLMQHERQHPDRGTALEIDPEGSYRTLAVGLRQPNGIGIGIDDELFITENQGQWVPACKFIHLREGDYHGCQFGTGDRFENREMIPPAVWLPQDEIGNSPGQPVPIDKGPYEGQMIYGEVTHGGIKRVFLEKVGGAYQGCVFRFTQGMEAGINRLVWGPDEKLYAGGVGMNGNWSHNANRFGLQCLAYNGISTFEMLRVEATAGGFNITFTEPLSEKSLELIHDSAQIQQWHYMPTSQYGGPKLDLTALRVSAWNLSEDGKTLHIQVPDLKEKYVIYIKLPPGVISTSGNDLWSGDVWYTLNQIPVDSNI